MTRHHQWTAQRDKGQQKKEQQMNNTPFIDLTSMENASTEKINIVMAKVGETKATMSEANETK